jgi:hypothetical protein
MRVLGLDRRVAEATKDMAQTLVILGPSPSHSDENLVLTGALGATNADIATVGFCSLEGRERIMFLFRRATSKHAARASCMYIVTPRTWMMMTTTTTERKGRSRSCLPAWRACIWKIRPHRAPENSRAAESRLASKKMPWRAWSHILYYT